MKINKVIRSYFYFEFGLSLIIALVFIISGVSKIFDISSFAQSITAYNILNYRNSFLTGVIIAYLEVFCGFFVLLDSWKKSSLYILIFLMFLFSSALISVLIRGVSLDNCGCIPLFELSIKHSLYKNFVLTSLIVLILKPIRQLPILKKI